MLDPVMVLATAVGTVLAWRAKRAVGAAGDADHAHERAHPRSGFIETVVVIGTAIMGTPIDSPYSVTSMDRDRLEARGTSTASSPRW